MSPEAGWVLQEEVVPRLGSAIPRVVHCVGSEDHQELIQDATAMAAKMLHNTERAGKRVTPGNIAYYTIQHVKSGRRSTGSSTVDAYGSQTQLNGRSRFTSLDEEAAVDEECGQEIFELHDVLGADQEDPAAKAARKVDWEDFCSELSSREKAVIEYLAEGESIPKAARQLGISSSRLQEIRNKLAVKVLEFMGVDILNQIRRQPQWKDGLNVTREKLACREERCRL